MMERKITLQDLAGYVTERCVGQMLLCLAQHWKPGLLSGVAPTHVLVEEGGFVLEKAEGEKAETEAFLPPEVWHSHGGTIDAESAEVWTLGALAFYALLGLNVFEGKGGRTQTAQTPIPLVGRQHCQLRLGELIRRCLSYVPAERPAMKDVVEVAQEVVSHPTPRSKRLTNRVGRSYGASLVSFWPEEMMPLVLVLLLWLLPVGMAAQSSIQVTQEMQELVKRCKALRLAKNKAQVAREFENDTQWTLMDELSVDRMGECTIRDKVDSFAVNNICFRIAKRKGGVTNMGGRFRSGLDPRYRYSLIEVPVKKGATVNYRITGRVGEQLLAVAAYEAAAEFEVNVTKDGKDFVGQKNQGNDGVVYLALKGKVLKGDTFVLSISNKSGKNMPFVIINYNSRK